ncbi:MAG: hypothetical protein JWN83_422 [Chitinophagaceae bacterium]|nr:hypothetical protein [Chitinophagaceae bacterium]
MIYCLNCGKGIPDQSKFCTFCGTAVPTVDPQNPNIAVPRSTPQNVNPTTPTMPPQYVNPVSQTPPGQQYVNVQQPVAGTKNEFYKNVGFWGAVLTFIGFFLPYVNGIDVSFYYLVTDLATDKPELYLYLIFPISAAILIIQGLTGMFPKLLVVIFKMLPLLTLILLIIGASNSGDNLGFMGDGIGTILSNIGIGLYMTVIGTILMLFFRTTKTKT